MTACEAPPVSLAGRFFEKNIDCPVNLG